MDLLISSSGLGFPPGFVGERENRMREIIMESFMEGFLHLELKIQTSGQGRIKKEGEFRIVSWNSASEDAQMLPPGGEGWVPWVTQPEKNN